jgi:hypothetical protein
MRSMARRASDASIGGRTVQGVSIAAIAGGLFWLVWIYGNGLRDPRFLDGWMLAVAMGVQVYFHIARKKGTFAPKAAARWRKIHIFLGYLLIAAFVSHSDFSLPDTAFEWALWAAFVLVAASGVVGTYLTWSLETKRRIDDGVTYDRIPTLRAELAQEADAVVARTVPAAVAIGLPAPPHDAWIMDLYTAQLRGFLQRPRHFSAHLIGSQRPLKRLTDDIDNLSPYVDPHGQEKLASLKRLVIEKDRLDFARVYLGLSRAWLFVHVPATYALIVLAVVHVIVVYAFSSAAWW